tara:strand:+ start:12673 stop:13074 length:402 start_codon:yes stop_codon:yes gene_type:complete
LYLYLLLFSRVLNSYAKTASPCGVATLSFPPTTRGAALGPQPHPAAHAKYDVSMLMAGWNKESASLASRSGCMAKRIVLVLLVFWHPKPEGRWMSWSAVENETLPESTTTRLIIAIEQLTPNVEPSFDPLQVL